MRNRYLLTKKYEIVYFNEKNLASIANKICDTIKSINQGKICASDVSFKTENNSLVVYVTYQEFVIDVKEIQPNMQKYNYSINI